MSNIKYILSIGSNKNRSVNLNLALLKIKTQFKLHQVSKKYKFDCIRNQNNPQYLNQIVIISSEYSSEKVNIKLKEIENGLGKVKTKAQCTIDIDLVFILKKNNEISVFNDKTSTFIPHIIVPCAELIPNKIHPEKKQEFLELKNQLKELTLC